MPLIVFLRSNQPANHVMLQKEPPNRLQDLWHKKCKVVVKDPYIKTKENL